MDLFFADDSRVGKPTRKGMSRPLVAAGGVLVPCEELATLERGLGDICRDTGFPPGAEGEFKWSPGSKLWMHGALRGDARTAFHRRVFGLAAERRCRAIVVISEEGRKTLSKARSNAEDVVVLLLERIQIELERRQRSGLVVIDRPGGDAKDQDSYLSSCAERLSEGTKFAEFTRIPHSIVTSPSKLSRCIQLADLVTGCTAACVGGESSWAEPLFRELIVPLLATDYRGRRGGCGLKIHPDYNFRNLYHWLSGDDFINTSRYEGLPLPMEGHAYVNGANDPRTQKPPLP